MGIISGNSNQMTHVLKQYTSDKIDNFSLSQVQAFIGLEYYFPEFRNTVKKKALDHYN